MSENRYGYTGRDDEDEDDDRPESDSPDGTWMNARELAAHLGISLFTVHHWTRSGKIPCDKSQGPRKTRYNAEAVQAAIANQSEREIKEEVATATDTPNEVSEDESYPNCGADDEDSQESSPGVAAAYNVDSDTTDAEIGGVLRQIAKDLLFERAEELAAQEKFKDAYLTMQKFISIDQKLAEIF